MRFPLKSGRDTLLVDVRSGRWGWYILEGSGRGATAPRRLPTGSPGSTWLSPSLRFLLTLRADGALWRISIPEGKASRLPPLFNGLNPNYGECQPSYDDTEMAFIKTRLDCRLGLLDNVFE